MKTQLVDFLNSNDTATKQFRILSYLTLSSLIAYLLSAYVLNNPILTAIIAPPINYLLYLIGEQLKKDGYDKTD